MKRFAVNRYLVIVFIFTLAAMGCAEIKPALENDDWQLQQYLDDNGQMQPVLAGAAITAMFRDGKIQGRAGCNQYFSAYLLGQNQEIKLSQTGSTQMACPPPVAQQEYRYFTLLSMVDRYQAQGDKLVFLDTQQQKLLQYVRMQPMTLENTLWQATGINNGRGGVESNANTPLVNALFSDGKLSGNAACNQFSASYEVKGDQMIIGPAMTTRKYCGEPDGVMQLEQEFLQALKQVKTYRLKEKRLELRDAKGSLQVLFEAKPGTPGL